MKDHFDEVGSQALLTDNLFLAPSAILTKSKTLQNILIDFVSTNLTALKRKNEYVLEAYNDGFSLVHACCGSIDHLISP